MHGLEAMKEHADTFVNAFPDFRMTIEDQIAEGDKVVSRLTFRGAHKGKMMGIASPRILIPILELYQNADGSITIPIPLRSYMNGKEKIVPF